MSRRLSQVESIGTGDVSESSLSTVSGVLVSPPSAPPPPLTRHTSAHETRGPSAMTCVSSPALSPEVTLTNRAASVEKQLFRSQALPPPVDGVVGVVVRVRPLSTKEHADPSVKTCVQCLKDSVILGGVAVPRSGSLSSLGRSATEELTRGAPGAGSAGAVRHLPIIKTREEDNCATTAASQAATSSSPASAASGPARRQQFRADQVFHQSASQIDVYEQACRHIVEGVFQGINGSILAYGATGSGKTHTMFGGSLSAAGVVYQAVRDIYDEKVRLEEEEHKLVKIKCSFVEIYNEEVFDLLVPPSATLNTAAPPTSSSSAPAARVCGRGGFVGGNGGTRLVNGRAALQVRDAGVSSLALNDASSNTDNGVPRLSTNATTTRSRKKNGKLRSQGDAVVNPESLVISGLTYTYPPTLDEFAQAIEQGYSKRVTAATGANAHSSRSHAIITVEVQVLEAAGQQGSGGGTVARIRFCDLAGSERAAATSNTGMRLREGGNINRSLLALGAVVQALAHRARYPNRHVFVPYRGSKLTRLLRDGIGGNCRTQMLFCLSPSSRQYEESVNTMLFAMQAKEIQVVAKRNAYQVNSAQVTKNQEEIIEELRADLATAREELCRLRAFAESSDRPSFSRRSSIACPPPTFAGTGNGASSAAGVVSVPSSPTPSTVPCPGALVSFASHSGTSVNAGKALPVLSRPDPIGFNTNATASSSALYSNLPTVSELSARPPVSVIGPHSSHNHNGTLDTPMSPDTNHVLDDSTVRGEGTSGRGGGGGFSTAAGLAGNGYARGRSATPSPGLGGVGRPSVFQDSANLFSELEAKFKAFTEEKKSIYHQMRDTQEQHAQRDIELRDQKWRLARFLASGALGDVQRGGPEAGTGTTSGGTVVTPVGVAGLRQVIRDMEAANAQEDTRMAALQTQMDDIDCRIADSRRELLREKQYTALELLLDNANLRQNGTEAESLAAHYHQQWHSALKRQEEYAQALEAATEALRAALQMLSADSQAAEQARLALVYAELPTTTTSEMIPVFERALKRQQPQLLHDGATSVSILMPPTDRRACTGGIGDESGGGSHARSTSGGSSGPLGMPPLPASHNFARTPSSSLVLSVNEMTPAARHLHTSAAAGGGGTDDLAQHFQQLVDAASQFRTGDLPDGVVARGRRGSHAGQSVPTKETGTGRVPAPTRRACGAEHEPDASDDEDGPSRAAETRAARAGGAAAPAVPHPAEVPSGSARDGRKTKRMPSFLRSYSTSGFQRDSGKKKDNAATSAEGKTTRIMKSKSALRKKKAAGRAGRDHSAATGASTGSGQGNKSTAAPPPAALLARRASAPASAFSDRALIKARVPRGNTSAGEAKSGKQRVEEGACQNTVVSEPARFRRTVTDTAKLSASPMTKRTAPSPERQSSASPRGDRTAAALLSVTPVRENAASKLRQAAALQAAQRNHDPYLPTGSPTRRDVDKAARRTKKKSSAGNTTAAATGTEGTTLSKAPAALSPKRTAARRRAHLAFSRSQTAVTVPSSANSPFHPRYDHAAAASTKSDTQDSGSSQPALFGRRACSAGRLEAEKRAHTQEENYQALFNWHEQIQRSHATTPHRSRSALVTQERGRRDSAGEKAPLKERNLSENSSATCEEGLTDRPSA